MVLAIVGAALMAAAAAIVAGMVAASLHSLSSWRFE